MGMDPLFKGKLSIELQVEAGMTYNLWTLQAIRLGTWILTQNMKSVYYLQDQVREELDLLAQLSKQEQNVLVSTQKWLVSCKHLSRAENVSYFTSSFYRLP